MKNIYKLLLIIMIGINGCFIPVNNVYADDEDVQEQTVLNEENGIQETDDSSIMENSEIESEPVETEDFFEVEYTDNGPVTGDYVVPQGNGFLFKDSKMDGVSYLYEAPSEGNGVNPIDDDVIVEVEKLIKEAISTKPFTTNEVINLMGNSKNTLLKESNNESLVKTELISDNGDRSEYIYIVDENAVVFVVKDTDGRGIPNAYVSISYLDDSGNRINRTITTTDGEVKGIAAFDNLKGTRYGFVDIEASGYHSVTFLDEEMTGGVVKNVVLEKNRDSEIYLRTVDLDGRDLINNDTTLSLVENYDETLRFSLIVSATGNKELPETVKLISSKDNRTIYTFSNPAYYKGSIDSYIFQADEKWVTQDCLLKEKDELVLDINGERFPLKNVVVENAQAKPQYIDDKDMPVKGDSVIADTEDGSSLMNIFNIGLSELSLNVSVGITPSGNFWIMCTKKIEGLSHDMEKLFSKTPSPKAAEKTGTIMERLEKSVVDNFENAIKTYEKIDERTSALLVDPFYGKINTSIVAMISGGYNKEAQRYEGDASIALNFSFTMGKQAFTMISFVPVTFGAEFSIGANAKLGVAINADTLFPPTGVEFDGYRSKPVQLHANPTIKAFVGVGLRNFLGFDFTGTAALDLALVWHAADKGDLDLEEPHRFIDFSANLALNIYSLVSTKTIIIIGTDEPVRLKDNWDKYKSSAELLSSGELNVSEELTPIDLTASAEKIKAGSFMQETSSDETGVTTLAKYKVDVPALSEPSGLELLSGGSYVDNQIQMITTGKEGDDPTKTTTALFRLIAKDGLTKLVYQLQDPETGKFEDTLYEVPMPDGRSVYEFAATDQKMEMHNVPSGYVYIGAVTGDVNTNDPDRRAYSTSVVGVIVDINNGTLIKQKIVKTQTENDPKFFFAPLPAHTTDDVVIAYKEAESYTTCDRYINYLATTAGNIEYISANVPVYCAGIVNSDWEPTFWTVDTVNSNETTLALKGVNGKGEVSHESPYGHADDANFHISFNITDFKQKFKNTDPISCIGTLRGKEFIIVAGNLYRLDGANSDHDTITAVKVENADYSDVTLSGGNGHYQMLTDHQMGTLFITSAKTVYEVEEGATYKMLGTELELDYIIEEEAPNIGTVYALHGPRKYMLDDIDVYKYTCSYDSSKMGIALAVDAYHDSTNSTCDVYTWRENAGYGFELTDFFIKNNVITNTQEYVDGYITYQNAGYGKSTTVTIQVSDSSGKALTQATYNSSTGEYTDRGDIYGYSYASLYPADKITIPIHFKANPEWGTNTAEKITVSMLNENGEVISRSSLTMDSPRLSFSGKQEVLNGDHYVSFDVSNNSIIAAERGNILLVGVYSDNSKNIPIDPENAFDCPNILRTLSTGKERGVYNSGNKESNQKYNISYNIESMWNAHIGEGLTGVNVYFVSRDGKLISDNSISISNPYVNKTKENNSSQDNNQENEIPVNNETVRYPYTKKDTIGTVNQNETKEERSYPVLYIDGKEVIVDDKVSLHKGIEGYLLYMMDSNNKKVLIGTLSKDRTSITLFEDYLKVLGNGDHKAELVYEDGHKESLSVNTYKEELTSVEVKKPSKKTCLIPLLIIIIILIILITYLIYRNNRNRKSIR